MFSPKRKKKHVANFWKNKSKTFHHILDADSILVAIFNYETMLPRHGDCIGYQIYVIGM
jgi:hypothetical protein